MAPPVELQGKMGARADFKLSKGQDKTSLTVSLWPQSNESEAQAMLPPYGGNQSLIYGESPLTFVSAPMVLGSEAVVALSNGNNLSNDGWWLRYLIVVAGKDVIIIQLRSRRPQFEDWCWAELSRIAELQIARLSEIRNLPALRKRLSPFVVRLIVLCLLALLIFWPRSHNSLTAGNSLVIRATGGRQTIALVINDANSCTWSSSPKIPQFDISEKCSSGKVSRVASFGANTSGQTKHFVITFIGKQNAPQGVSEQEGGSWTITQPSEKKTTP